jgi:hypothetical protein
MAADAPKLQGTQQLRGWSEQPCESIVYSIAKTATQRRQPARPNSNKDQIDLPNIDFMGKSGLLGDNCRFFLSRSCHYALKKERCSLQKAHLLQHVIVFSILKAP